MTIQRQDDGRVRVGTATLGLRRGASPSGEQTEVFRFGAASALVPVFRRFENLILADDGLKDGERLLAVGQRNLQDAWELADIEATLDGRPVTVTVCPTDDGGKPILAAERAVVVQPKLVMGNTAYTINFLADGSVLRATAAETVTDETGQPSDPPRVRLRLVDGSERIVAEADLTHRRLLDVLGMWPRLKFDAISKSRPAAKAGLKPGDIVVSYGGRSTPTLAELRQTNRQFVGQGTQIVVFRDGATQPAVDVRPRRQDGRPRIGTEVGVDQQHLVVADVRPGSPAATAAVARGCVIEKVNDQPVANWPELIRALTALKDRPIRLHGRNGSQPFTAKIGVLTEEAFNPSDYRYVLFPLRPFGPMTERIRNTNPLEALLWGGRETIYSLQVAYATLRALADRTVSPRELRGPIGMADIAVQIARRSPMQFVYLMAMISVGLAVINFLPLPVLDGGHAVFLLIEKIRGRPLSVKIMNAVQITGLVLLVGLVLIITWRDVVRIVESFT